jgi:SAM-dependent methyltransferase
MKDLIQDNRKDPLGKMLLDFFGGKRKAFLNVWSSTLEMSTMRGDVMFRNFAAMDDIDKTALTGCRGKVLDVGAGAGCHSLELQARGLAVDPIDISPGCVEVMQRRGVIKPTHRNVLAIEKSQYDTVLMVMNGLGISGSLDGLNLFLQYLHALLAPGGQLLADSTDLTEKFMARGLPVYDGDGGYCGETDFVMIYKGMRSDPFAWLYVDFPLLQTMCTFHGFNCEKLAETQGKQFLTRITRSDG